MGGLAHVVLATLGKNHCSRRQVWNKYINICIRRYKRYYKYMIFSSRHAIKASLISNCFVYIVSYYIDVHCSFHILSFSDNVFLKRRFSGLIRCIFSRTVCKKMKYTTNFHSWYIMQHLPSQTLFYPTNGRIAWNEDISQSGTG